MPVFKAEEIELFHTHNEKSFEALAAYKVQFAINCSNPLLTHFMNKKGREQHFPKVTGPTFPLTYLLARTDKP